MKTIQLLVCLQSEYEPWESSVDFAVLGTSKLQDMKGCWWPHPSLLHVPSSCHLIPLRLQYLGNHGDVSCFLTVSLTAFSRRPILPMDEIIFQFLHLSVTFKYKQYLIALMYTSNWKSNNPKEHDTNCATPEISILLGYDWFIILRLHSGLIFNSWNIQDFLLDIIN